MCVCVCVCVCVCIRIIFAEIIYGQSSVYIYIYIYIYNGMNFCSTWPMYGNRYAIFIYSVTHKYHLEIEWKKLVEIKWSNHLIDHNRKQSTNSLPVTFRRKRIDYWKEIERKKERKKERERERGREKITETFQFTVAMLKTNDDIYFKYFAAVSFRKRNWLDTLENRRHDFSSDFH